MAIALEIYEEIDDNNNFFIEFHELIEALISDEEILKAENLKKIFFYCIDNN